MSAGQGIFVETSSARSPLEGFLSSNARGDAEVDLSGTIQSFSTAVAVKASGDAIVTARDGSQTTSSINGINVSGNISAKLIAESGSEIFTSGPTGAWVRSRSGDVNVQVEEGASITSDTGRALIATSGDDFFGLSLGNGNVSVESDGTLSGGVRALAVKGKVDIEFGATSSTTFNTDLISTENAAVYAASGGEFSFGGLRGGDDVSVTADGLVRGAAGGIYATTTLGDVSVEVGETGSVTGEGLSGVEAVATTGDVTVVVDGSVSGATDGVVAQTTTGNVTVDVGALGSVNASTLYGVKAETLKGDIEVDIAGHILGEYGAGVALNTADGDVDAVIAASGSIFSGNDYGMDITASKVSGDEIGAITLQNDGDIFGRNLGINLMSIGAYNTTITTGANSTTTSSGFAGIQASSAGYVEGGDNGKLTIDALGQVRGDFFGIWTNSQSAEVKVHSAVNSEITAVRGSGIWVSSHYGDTSALVEGHVSGVAGVIVQSDEGRASAVSEVTAEIIGTGVGSLGIAVASFDEAEVSHSGFASADEIAISAFGGTNAKITTEKGSVASGGELGLFGETDAGSIEILNGGFAEGGDAGIFVTSNYSLMAPEVQDGALSIHNGATGYVRNTSRLLDSNAIRLAGSPDNLSSITNDGLVEGTIQSDFDALVTNNGVWKTLGIQNFSNDGTIANGATGKVYAAHSASIAELTAFHAETISNSGVISIADDVAGSGAKVSDTLHLDGDYAGGGTIALDAYVDGAANSVADQVRVFGDATGVTNLRITNTNAGAGGYVDEASGDGIIMAIVDGTANFDAFALEGGSFSTGLFDYYLIAGAQEGVEGTTFEMFSKPNADVVASSEVSSTATGIWNETTLAWLDRQDDLRNGLNQGPVITAAADVGSRADDSAQRNVWLQAMAGKTDHSGTARLGGTALDTGYDQRVHGLAGGIDFGANLSGGGTLLFGALGGYAGADVDFASGNSGLDLNGYSFGAYATFMKDGFFASAMLRQDLMDMQHAINADRGSTDVASLGARGDVGYRIRHGNMIVEPLASLSVVNTDIDAYNVGVVNFARSSQTAVDAALGARLAYETGAFSISTTGRVWNNFSDPASVAVSVGGSPALGVAGEGAFGGVYGEVATSLSVQLNERAMVYAGGSAKFDNSTKALSGFGGVNFSW